MHEEISLVILKGGKNINSMKLSPGYPFSVVWMGTERYAKAAAQTTCVAQLDPVPDGSCAVVALCYRTDIVLTILREDGFAQAALVCSSPEVIKAMTPEYINSIASSYGVVGECSVYGCEETMALIAQ